MGYSLVIWAQLIPCVAPSTSLAPLAATHDLDGILVIQVRKWVKDRVKSDEHHSRQGEEMRSPGSEFKEK